jgi:hypothetical protein
MFTPTLIFAKTFDLEKHKGEAASLECQLN